MWVILRKRSDKLWPILTVALRELCLKTVVASSLGPNGMRWDHPIQHNPPQVAQSNTTRPQPGTCCKHSTRWNNEKRQRSRDSFLTHLLGPCSGHLFQPCVLGIFFYNNKGAGPQVIWGFSQWDAPSSSTPEWWLCTGIPRKNASYWITNISCNIWGLTNSFSCPPLLGALTRAHPHTVWLQ